MSKGHFGISHSVPYREAVLISEVEMYCICSFGDIGSALYREVVPISESPLSNSIYLGFLGGCSFSKRIVMMSFRTGSYFTF